MSASITTRLTPSFAAQSRTATAKAQGNVIAPDVSDEALVEVICRGDLEALASLFHRHARLVRGIAYRVLRDPSEADDLLQDIFLWLPRLSSTFDPTKGSAQLWLRQVAYRRAICRRRYLTTRHFYKRLDLDGVAEELGDPRAELDPLDGGIDGMFGLGVAKQVFDALSENQRQTLRLYFVEGYTLGEIAQKLGQPLGNIKHHYFRGLDRLRKQLLGSKPAPQDVNMSAAPEVEGSTLVGKGKL